MAQARRVSKKKVPRRTAKSKQGGIPGWAWMLLGLLIGALITLGIFISQKDPQAEKEVAPKATVKVEKAKPVTQEKTEQKKSLLNFDFYHILPEMEVLIPDSELQHEPVQQHMNYFLQVGSFKNREDAESRSAELFLLNFEPIIQSVTIDGSNTWHRVRIGPFSNRLALDKARRLLDDNNIQQIVLRERRQ